MTPAGSYGELEIANGVVPYPGPDSAANEYMQTLQSRWRESRPGAAGNDDHLRLSDLITYGSSCGPFGGETLIESLENPTHGFPSFDLDAVGIGDQFLQWVPPSAVVF